MRVPDAGIVSFLYYVTWTNKETYLHKGLSWITHHGDKVGPTSHILGLPRACEDAGVSLLVPVQGPSLDAFQVSYPWCANLLR